MKPAMDADEWARWRFPATTFLLGNATAERWSEIEQAHANDAVAMLEGGLQYRSGAIHGVAARLLQDQPFGFTRMDVTRNREQADYRRRLMVEDPLYANAHEEYAVWHDSMADRIEALLPPEDTQ